MKDEKWLVYLIVGFTSITTVLLLTDGSLLGFARAVAGAAILDGLILYWDNKRIKLKSDKQRDISRNLMWAGVGIMLTFAVGYGVELFAPVDALKTVDLFGYSFQMTLHDFVLLLAASTIGGWVVLTLGCVLYLRQIDPEINKDLELTKALQERDDEEMKAYRQALKVTARQIGVEKAVRLFRKNLEDEGYTDAEINEMEKDARISIAEFHGSIPVNSDNAPVNSNVRQFSADTENFTSPSTLKK